MEPLLSETEPLLNRLLELGTDIDLDEYHSDTVEAVMEFIGKVKLLIELRN